MTSKLPSFGDISVISPEGNSIHENVTIINSPPPPLDVDSQETVFNESQSQQIENDTQNNSEAEAAMDIEPESEVTTGENASNINISEAESPIINELLPEQDHQNERNDMNTIATMEEDEDETQFNEEDEDETQFNEEEEGGEQNDEADADEEDQEEPQEKIFQLPISKIKRIMKNDPDTNLIGKDALAAIAISTENFIAMLAQQSFKLASRNKRKRITLEHLKATIAGSPACEFLEGTLPEFGI